MPKWSTLRRILPRRRPRPGTLQTLRDVWSPQLGNRRDVIVYLPPSYEGRRRFPVVFVQDGQNLFDPRTAHAGDWGLHRSLDALAATGLETIVVGVWNLGAERLAEYSPFVDAANGGGRGDRYVDFLTETLKPMIDQRFRTDGDRSHTGIAGSSMGGLVSLYGFFRASSVFGFAGVLSPSLWYAAAAIFPFIETAPAVSGRIYLDIGLQEGDQSVVNVRRLRDLLLAKGYHTGEDLLAVEDPNGSHDEAAWGRRFPQALSFLLSNRGLL